MWKLIDYNENDSNKRNSRIDPEVIDKYFKGIFQANHLDEKPIIDRTQDVIGDYSVYHRFLDKEFSRNELDLAICEIGRGIGLDGIEKKIASLFSPSLRDALVIFFNKVFVTTYPKDWRYQILRPEKKRVTL